VITFGIRTMSEKCCTPDARAPAPSHRRRPSRPRGGDRFARRGTKVTVLNCATPPPTLMERQLDRLTATSSSTIKARGNRGITRAKTHRHIGTDRVARCPLDGRPRDSPPTVSVRPSDTAVNRARPRRSARCQKRHPVDDRMRTSDQDISLGRRIASRSRPLIRPCGRS